MRLSYSAINTYQNCPLMYKFGYIDKMPTKPNEKMWFGSHLHEILQFILNDLYHLPTQAETVRYYAENFDKSVFSSEAIAQSYFENGLKIIEKFYRQITEAMPEIVSTEEKFVLPMGKHYISGIFDRVDKLADDHFEIIDYKTGRMPDQRRLDKDLQLTLYDWAAKQKWPHLKNIKLSLHFLRPDIKMSTKRGKAHHEELKETVHKTAEKIEKEKFEPKAGPLCNYCGFAEFCPLMKDKFRKEKHEIDKILEKYLKLKIQEDEARKESERLKPHIHDYLDQEGVKGLYSDLGSLSRRKKSLIHKLNKKKK